MEDSLFGLASLLSLDSDALLVPAAFAHDTMTEMNF